MEGNALLEIRLLVHYCKCFRLKKDVMLFVFMYAIVMICVWQYSNYWTLSRGHCSI